MKEINNKKIKRIVIWGLKYKYHTQRHIHKAFFETAKKMGLESIWLEDIKNNALKIKPGDLIISTQAIGKMVPEKFSFEDYNLPIKEDVFYCLHNYKEIFTEKINNDNLIKLQVYNNVDGAEQSDQKWNPVTFFNSKTKTLYQPWGTNLLPEEFKKPTFNKNSLMFWVGNVWNDKYNQGNIAEINELKDVLKKNKIKFQKIKVVPDLIHIFLIRKSRIAPAIGGGVQVQRDYLPCRMFKNISYGQLGITNIKKFKDILGNSFIDGDTIEEIVENALKLSKEDYISKIIKQQQEIKKYTYKNSIENIIKAFQS
jgi:hypothetical protein